MTVEEGILSYYINTPGTAGVAGLRARERATLRVIAGAGVKIFNTSGQSHGPAELLIYSSA